MTAKAPIALIIVAALGLGGCFGYPLGMSKREWRELSPSERLIARKSQAEIDDARDARLAREQAAERARIDKLYREAPYGSLLQCTLAGGAMLFDPTKPVPHEPLAFTLARGEQKYVRLRHAQSRRGTPVSVSFSLNGQHVRVCDTVPGSGLQTACPPLFALGTELAAGKRWTVDLPDLLSGAELACAFPPHRKPVREARIAAATD